MSTSSAIAIRQGESFTTIYCHHDGHPRTMLPLLRKYYNSFDLANKLISHGDASYIDEKLEPTSDFHKLNTPEPGVCMFYHRDHGDSWESCRPACYTRQELFRQQAFNYVHVFEDGEWNSYTMRGQKIDFVIPEKGEN